MAPFAPFLVERREAPPPYVTGGRAPPLRRAPDPMVRRALRYWARRLPALHSLVFEGHGKKGEGRARQPEK